MDETMILPLALRGTERLLIVVAAMLCIYFGYKLFRVVPLHRDSEGQFSIGDISVTLAKVGPGVFFSLFGAFVLYQSVESSLQMSISCKSTDREDPQTQDINWMGTTSPSDRAVWSERAVGPIKILNCLEKRATGSKLELRRIHDSVHTAKVAIIADVWQSEWGDSDTFVQISLGNVVRESPIGAIYYAVDEGC